mgnify:CR=1 FL=1
MTREELSAVLAEYAGAEAETQGQLASRILDENDNLLQEMADREAARATAVANEAALRKQYVEKFLGAVPNEPDLPKLNEHDPKERMTFDSLFK